jgi:signal transduction histidine kinase
VQRFSITLFALILCFSLILVGWWTWLQMNACSALQSASEQLALGQADAAAKTLGADSARSLAQLAAHRRVMFLSEGLTFEIALLFGGVLFFTSMRREARLRAGQDRFLAAATHELKTPLATIRLLLESLAADTVPAQKRARHLQSGLREIDRLERGLTNVLTAAGLRTAVRPLRLETGDLAADVQQALASMAARAEAAAVELQAEAMTPAVTARDAEALQLILHNLLDNAIKYSAPGSRVSVHLRRDGPAFAVAVRDQGRGLSSEELGHAFQPFWRGKDTATGGVGLGLHLTRELARAHGGSVEVSSEGRGRGAEFVLRLPAGDAT